MMRLNQRDLHGQIAQLIRLHQAGFRAARHHRFMETKEPMSTLPQIRRASPPMLVTEYLSRGDVARLFGVSLSTVTRWARTGLVPTVRTPGGHYRYPADAVRRVAASGLPPMENVE
jgi:excisionase family DNA binding protein